MSHFYGSLQGNRGRVTRCGSKNSGIVSHLGGHNVGCMVVCRINKDGVNEISVYRTTHSLGGNEKLIATIKEKETDERRFN